MLRDIPIIPQSVDRFSPIDLQHILWDGQGNHQLTSKNRQQQYSTTHSVFFGYIQMPPY